MSFDASQFRESIIRPVLQEYDLYSESAEELLMGTAAQESHLGTYLRQIKGSALGVYQMEPQTHDDIWNNFVLYRHPLLEQLESDFGKFENATQVNLVGNLWYATIMTRLHYLRVSSPFPKPNDIDGLAKYWKTYYNTSQGKGTEQEFIENYLRYCQ